MDKLDAVASLPSETDVRRVCLCSVILSAVIIAVMLIISSIERPIRAGESDTSQSIAGWIAVVGAAIVFGSTGVPMKSPSLAALEVDCFVFAVYTSIGIFLVSVPLVIYLFAIGKFRFEVWGILGAADIVIIGYLAFMAVQQLGYCKAPAIWAGVGMTCAFLWGTFVFKESTKNVPMAVSAIVLLIIGVYAVSTSQAKVEVEVQVQVESSPIDNIGRGKSNAADGSNDNSHEDKSNDALSRGSDSSGTGRKGDGSHGRVNRSAQMFGRIRRDVECQNSLELNSTVDNKEHIANCSHGEYLNSNTTNRNMTDAGERELLDRDRTVNSESKIECNESRNPRDPGPLIPTTLNPLRAAIDLEKNDIQQCNNSEKIKDNRHGNGLKNTQSYQENSNTYQDGDKVIKKDGDSSIKNINHHERRRFMKYIENLKLTFGSYILCFLVGFCDGTLLVPFKLASEINGNDGDIIIVYQYLASFGISSILVSPALFLIYCFTVNKRRIPLFHCNVALVPGVASGVLWAAANFLSVHATYYLGIKIGFPLTQTCVLIAAMWGILYFKEFDVRKSGYLIRFCSGILLILVGAYLLGSSG